MGQATISDPETRAPALPGAITRVLTRLDRRLRTVAAVRGLGEAAVVAGVGALVGMGADLAWVLPRAVRWGFWGAWLAASGLVLALRVIAPWVRRVRLLDLAALAEQSHPAVLGERLTAAVGLLGEGGRANGSPALVAAIARDASTRAAAVDPARVVSFRRAGRWLVGGGLAVALAAVPALVRPDPFATLARRFLAPWANIERVGRWTLTVAPGDAVAAIGGDLRIAVQVRPRFNFDRGGTHAPPAGASVEWFAEDEDFGQAHRLAMARLDASASSAFATTVTGLAGSLRYRVVSGSAVSRWFRVRAIAPPAVARIEARIEPPAYMRIAPGTAADPARIEAWEGSRVVLNVQSTRPVGAVEVGWPGRDRPAAAILAADRRTATASLTATATGAYTLALRDGNGLSSAGDAPRRMVVVRPDAPPLLAVQGPEPPAEASASDTLRVAIAARDDFAVAKVELHYALARSQTTTEGHIAVRVAGLNTQAARGVAELALGSLEARPGDVVSYRVRVEDNRPVPNVVWSSNETLTIVAQAEPLQARRDRAVREALQAKLDALKAAAAENRQETEQLRYAADAAQRGNGRWDQTLQQALDHREGQARAVADLLQLLARELAATSTFHPLAPPARQIAEAEAEPGRALLDQARRAADGARRLDDLRRADTKLAAVSTRLDDLQHAFDDLARRSAEAEQLRDLAGREDDLANRTAEDAGKEGERNAEAERLRAEQAAVRKDLESLVAQSPELGAGARKPLDAAREAMSQAARDLADARGTPRARDAMKQAARDLRAAALARDGPQRDPGPPIPGPARDPASARAEAGTADLSAIQTLVRARNTRAWGELPGHLRTEILEMARGRYRDEYARLIQLYFQEIAAGAVGEAPEP